MENQGGLTPLASRRLGTARVEVVVGSLADPLGVEAVVNPTSASLGLDGGVGASLAQRADAVALAAACGKLAPLEVAKAVATPGFGLPSPNVIHCRGPRFGEPRAVEVLGETYWNVLTLAEESGFSSVAFPAVSSGAKGFPLAESARIAVEALKSFSPDFKSVRLIRFVLPERGAADVFAKELMRPPKLPKDPLRLVIPVAYSAAEIEAFRQGFFGDHDTKWFFYHEEPWLCVYRGNRHAGWCGFWLRLPEGEQPSTLVDVLMDREVGGNLGGKAEAEKLLEYLLDDRFGLLRIPDDLADCETIGNASFWVKRGKVALVASCCEDGLLSAEQARELGERLVLLADSLVGKRPGS